MTLEQELLAYQPANEQEARDLPKMLAFLREGETPFDRANETAHFTASAWVIGRETGKVLLIYHNIYQSWAWTGGHADGESDLLAVARREAQEETRIEHLTPIQTGAISLEILDVPSHVKRGRFVPCHLHLNMTYAFVGDDRDALQNKADENRAVQWLPIDKLADFVAEPAMLPIYRKILQRII